MYAWAVLTENNLNLHMYVFYISAIVLHTINVFSLDTLINVLI